MTNKKPKPETLELMYREVKDRLDSQFNSISDLDKKAITAIGFIGIVVGIILKWSETLLSTKNIRVCLYVLSIMSILSFLISIYFALMAFKVKGYRRDPNPIKLVEHYFYKKKYEVLEQIVDNLADSHKENEISIVKKGKNINMAVLFFFFGLVLYSFFIILYTFYR